MTDKTKTGTAHVDLTVTVRARGTGHHTNSPVRLVK